jgi:hypothetical protein
VSRAAAVVVALLLAAPGDARRRPDSPLDRLPPNVEVLTHFGERADFSPDNRRVAFMAKSFGDAFLIDLDTRELRCLTCGVPGAAFLRVMHLASGDYLLIGPERFEDLGKSRSRDNELWYLAREAGSRPVRLGRKMSEGAAVSKRSKRVAFAVGHAQDPAIPEGWKASNPAVSTDGRLMAFQVARTADEAGVGYGILLMRLEGR